MDGVAVSAARFPSVSAILPFEERLRIFTIPPVRFIGKSIRIAMHEIPDPSNAFREQFRAEGWEEIVSALPVILPDVIVWAGEYASMTNQYTYLICVATPAGTPVPEGFDHRDVPAGLIGHGATGEELEGRDGELAAMGYVRCDDHWCCVYNPYGDDRCCWIYPCRPVND